MSHQPMNQSNVIRSIKAYEQTWSYSPWFLLQGRGLFPRRHAVARSHLCGGHPRNAPVRLRPATVCGIACAQGPDPPYTPALPRQNKCFCLPVAVRLKGRSPLQSAFLARWDPQQGYWLSTRRSQGGLRRLHPSQCSDLNVTKTLNSEELNY
jgi:hypothetical protein